MPLSAVDYADLKYGLSMQEICGKVFFVKLNLLRAAIHMLPLYKAYFVLSYVLQEVCWKIQCIFQELELFPFNLVFRFL